MKKDRVIIIEDEADARDYISKVLNSNGYDTLTASSGSIALSIIGSHCPDLIVLDLGLPDMDGMDILKSVRSWSNLPIVVVSARTYERDKVAALDLGADDFIEKPFNANEFLARIRVALRHTRLPAEHKEVLPMKRITIGNMVIDYEKQHVFVDGRDVHLTQYEYKLVALLGQRAGKVLTYDYIIREIWGSRTSADNQLLRVNMTKIRRKIEKNPAKPEYIFTEIGVGYRMREADNNQGETNLK